MATKIQVRRDTATNWTSVNPTLSDGELGYETNTGYMKIGDGSTQWSSLSYFTPGAVDGDANTTYTLGTTASGSDANITLTGSDSTNDSVTLVAGTNVTLSVAGDNITAAIDTDLANYNNSNTGFITASSSDTLTNKAGNISQWTNDSNYLATSVSSPNGGQHLQWNGSAWVNTWDFSSSATSFLSGFLTNRYIEYRNALITIGSISSGDTVDFPTSSGTDAGIEWQVNNPGTDFIANLTPGPLNINTSQYFRIIIDNTSGGTKGSISGIKRNGTTQTVNWINGSLPSVSGEDVYDVYEIYCFRGDGGSDETWYAHLLTAGNSLSTLPDVDTKANSGPVNGYLLAYDSSSQKWENTNQIEGKITFRPGLFAAGTGLTLNSHMYDTPLTISEGDDVTFNLAAGSYGSSGRWTLENVNNNFTADITGVPTVTSVYDKWIIVVNNNISPGVGMTALKLDGVSKTINWAGGAVPKTQTGRFDIYEIERWKEATALGDEYIFVRHWNDDKYDGDITGSVFGDDSTVLVDGVNNTIPAANLSGALPALDASNLTNIPAGDIVTDTTPQLGGDLDAQGNNITSGGNVELETNKTLTFKTTVSGNDQGIGSIVASNGTNDFNKVSFKTGPDDYANNGEVNWATRVNGTLTSIFEINGSSLAKSGMVINPDSNAGIDFQIKGANDGLLVFVDSGLDKVGIGKIPANGILDVDGDVYATNFQGNLTGNVGNFNLASSVIDTTDSSGITVTPAVTMSSDLTVENNLVVDNNIQATSADISGNVAVGSNLTVTGTTTTNGIAVFEQGVIEGFSSLASATGVVAHNCANGHIFRHTGISADFTANFTNLGITDDHGTMVSLILVQGGTAYIPTAVQIDGAAQTILWQGGSAPSGTDSGTDIVSFSITQSAGTRTVLGQLTSYS